MTKKSKMCYDFFDISAEQHTTWSQLCPAGEYRILAPTAIPGVVPTALLAKANSVLVMGSGSPGGRVYYMANLNRIDQKAQAIDQQPFGLAFVGTMPLGSGCLIQHGNWGGRTSHPTADFWHCIQASGMKTYYPLADLPRADAGPISSLAFSSQGSAFSVIVTQLQQFVGTPDDQS